MCIQACTSATFYTILVTSAGFYINMCLYIDVMVKDLRDTLIEMGDDLQADQYDAEHFQSSFFAEVIFHNRILE